MFLDEGQTFRKLQRVIACLTADPDLQEDLLQEGLLHLWQVESQFPGQSPSWYLQNCRFRVLHVLASGRSVDSHKRCAAGRRISLDHTESEGEPIEVPDGGDVVDEVSFKDLQAALSQRLTRRERAVLDGLAAGLRLREVASHTHLSYPTALKYRRRIAWLVSQLGIPAPEGPEDRVAPPLPAAGVTAGTEPQPKKLSHARR